MLTIDIRTMDITRVVELMQNDKETLKDELLEDYTMLKTKYRELTREYNQKMHLQSEISSKYYSNDRINYKKELGLDKPLYGHIIYTRNLAENINIANEYNKSTKLFREAVFACELKDIVRLKAREIERLLKMLGVKVDYVNDFENKADDWLKDDIITSIL